MSAMYSLLVVSHAVDGTTGYQQADVRVVDTTRENDKREGPIISLGIDSTALASKFNGSFEDYLLSKKDELIDTYKKTSSGPLLTGKIL